MLQPEQRRDAKMVLVEPSRAPNLTPQRERPPELDPDLSPRLRAPACLQHHTEDAVDAEPGCQRRVLFTSPSRREGPLRRGDTPTSVSVSLSRRACPDGHG